MEKIPQIQPERDFDEIEDGDEKRLSLLEALSPSTARLFKELQDPALSKEEFFKRIAEYNDFRSEKQPELVGAYQQVSAEVFSGRTVTVKFNREGSYTISGSDHSK